MKTSAIRHLKIQRRVRQQRIWMFERLEDRRLLATLENFDSVTAPALPAGWSQTTTSTNPWATVAGAGSDTAPNHAFSANLEVTSDSMLTSPSFVLSSTTPLLQFRNAFDTESTWDGGVLEISINGGGFSDILAAGGSFLSGGYVSNLQTVGNGNTNPLAGRLAWHGSSGGYITTVVNLPNTAFNQIVALRWRLGSDNSVGVTGWRIDTISLESMPTDDFGDAPTSYPVTLAENGARHTVNALFLGASVDIESDGLHSVNATADGSDEDGVTIQGSFQPGSVKNISVTTSQAGGLLNAWIDWNRDGDWADVGEQVFTNQAMNAGANALTVTVPAGAMIGGTFARFRLSTASGIGFNGPATNGEVEDYAVNVSIPGAWNALGPFGATNGQVEGIADRPVTGAIHTVLAHPTNADIVYIGAVNGGVWKTTNATAAQPSWTPLTDNMPSQSIGSLVFDLADPTFNTVYAGIGRYSSFAQIGNNRIGLMRTTNGGASWQVVNGGGILTGKNISGIVANGNTIVVSVNVADVFSFPNIGIFRSTDGGASFTQISNGAGAATGLPGGVTYDLIVDPLNPATLYTSTVFSSNLGGVNGIYKSTNSGATWTRVSTPAMEALITNNTSNLEMAAGRNNEVYAGIINAGAFAGLFRSPDNGATWSRMDDPRTNENGTNVGLNPSGGKGPSSGAPEFIAGGQGNIHFSIVADPSNPNVIYVGGDRQPRTNGDTGGFPNSIGANDFSGRLFRGDASRPAGSQFVPLTHRNDVAAFPGGGTASNSSPHADSRDMTFDAAGNILEVDDGGIYRRTSPGSNTGDWFSVIGNLQVTEAHDAAWDSLSNVAMSGNQDTGSTFQPTENAPQWNSISTGDGGDIAIDNIQLAANNLSVRYSSFQNLAAFRRSVWTSTGQLQSFSFPALTPINGSPAITGFFRTPVETNNVAGNRLVIQGGNGLYESTDGGSTVNSIGAGLGATNIFANAIVYGGTQNNIANPNLVWLANGSDVFLRTAGAGSVTATPSDPTTSTILDLAVNSRDWSNAFVIDSDQVFQTTNSGTSWTDITGNLLGFANNLLSIAFVAGAASSAVIVGTNRGVFAMSSLQIGNWVALGNGFPTVLAYDLDYDPTDDILVVGTMGRGVWALRDVTTLIRQPATIVSRSVFYNNSAYETVGGVAGALDSSKVVLQAGALTQLTSFANVINYTLGINGLVLDVAGLASTALTAADFVLRMAPAGTSGVAIPKDWPAAPAPTVIIATAATPTTPGRIQLEWPDNAIQNTWLQIIVRANANTGLATPAVFYLGSALGDVNGAVGVGAAYRTGIPDLSAVQSALQNGQTGLTGIDNPLDIDKSRRVGIPDLSFVQSRVSAAVLLRNIIIPAAGSVDEGAAGSVPGTSAPESITLNASTQPIQQPSTSSNTQAATRDLPSLLIKFDSPNSRLEPEEPPNVNNASLQYVPIVLESWKNKRKSVDSYFEQLEEGKVVIEFS